MRKVFILILFVISTNLYGTNYYVKNGGSNSNSGLSDALAWATISKVNSVSFAAGDSILLKRGSTWKETLSPATSGTSGNRIIFGAYSTGAIPIIGGTGTVPGWNTTGNWTNQGSNRWSKSQTNSVSYRIRVWANGTELMRGEYTSDVNATTKFYYTPSVLWVYATSNPATYFSSMEMSGIYGAAMTMTSKNYLTFNNINFKGGGWSCIGLTGCSYIVFDGCSIGDGVPASGIASSSPGSTHVEIKNCIFDTGDRAMDAWVEPNHQPENSEDGIYISDGSKYWDIHDNQFISWGHVGINHWADNPSSTVTDINIYDNYFSNEDNDYGSAMGFTGTANCMTRVHVYRNHIYKMAAYDQYLISGGEILCYDNIIDGTRGTNKEGRNGYGIIITAYGAGEGIGQKFYNNTIVNCVDGGILLMNYGTYYIYDNEIVNNILAFNGADNSGLQLQISPSTGGYHVLDNVFKNNLLYSSTTTDVIDYRGTSMTVAEFNAENDNEGDTIKNNIYGDPLFVSTTDFHLQTSSPAINVGTSVGLGFDYDLVAVGNPPEIGAYEYPPVETTLPTMGNYTISTYTQTTISTGGIIINDGDASITDKGVCWSHSINPTTADSHTHNGTGTDQFTQVITALDPLTLYWVRAYATNSVGTAYSNNSGCTMLCPIMTINGSTFVKGTGGKIVVFNW